MPRSAPRVRSPREVRDRCRDGPHLATPNRTPQDAAPHTCGTPPPAPPPAPRI